MGDCFDNIKRLDFGDSPSSIDISAMYSGEGAAMEWALLDYFCRQHRTDGYQFCLPPHLLIEECGYTAGQFPKFTDDVFHLKTNEGERARFLLPTAETAILNVFRDEIKEPTGNP